jgi:NDP-sugar pyrophosphorylase family protein
MRAMILAAGLGTRLRPLTEDRPKALVEVAGRTMLEIALARLRAAGIREVIVNVHHLADMVVEYLEANDNFGMRIEISREETLLDTGGGLKKAGHFFLEAGAEEPFIVHNVDVVSTIDLGRMVQFHCENRSLATLAVQSRRSLRYLLFDERLQLCGRRSGADSEAELVRPSGRTEALAFCGVHVVSPRLFSKVTKEGVFSIIDCYLRLAGGEEKIVGFRADEYHWRDLGTPDKVRRAAEDVGRKSQAM